MNEVKIFLITAFLTAVAVTASGQQKPDAVQPGQYGTAGAVGSPGQPGGRPLSDAQRDEIRRKVDIIRLWRLTGALKLDATTSAKLSTFLGSIDEQRRNIHREQMVTIRTLQFALNSPKPDETKIKADLDTIEKTHLAMEHLILSEMNGLKSILTVEQRARYIVFQHEFTREMRGMIDTVHAGPGMGGMGPGGAMGIRSRQTGSGMGQGNPTLTPGK